MNNKPGPPFLKTLQVVHAALIIGLIIFSLIIIFLNQQKLNRITTEQPLPFIAIAAFVTVMNLGLSKIIFSKQIDAIKILPSVAEKIEKFRAAFILKMALLEGSAIFSLIVTFLTGSLIALSFAALIIIIMLFQRPSKFSISESLELSSEESDSIEEV